MEQAVDISRGVIKLLKRHLPGCDRVSRRVLQSSDCGDEPIGCIRLAFNSFNLFIPFEEPIAIASSFERKEKKGKGLNTTFKDEPYSVPDGISSLSKIFSIYCLQVEYQPDLRVGKGITREH